MKPLRDWMILEKFEHMSSSLLVPDSARDKEDDSTAYKVIDVGPGYHELTEFRKPDVEIGDIVIMEGLGIVKFRYAGKTYYAGQARYVAFKAEPTDEGGVL